LLDDEKLNTCHVHVYLHYESKNQSNAKKDTRKQKATLKIDALPDYRVHR